MALGETSSGDGIGGSSRLDFCQFDFSKPGETMEPVGSLTMDQRFTTITWGSFGEGSQGCPFGVLAGGFADGTVKLYNPAKAFQTRFQDNGVLCAKQVLIILLVFKEIKVNHR